MMTLTYDSCLLIMLLSKCFGIISMQTNNTLILYDTKFSQLEENKFYKAKFTTKPKEKLITNNLLLFNKCILIKEVDGSIYLRQKKQGKKLKLVSKNSTISKQQYTEQYIHEAYITSISQPKATFDLFIATQHKDLSDDNII